MVGCRSPFDFKDWQLGNPYNLQSMVVNRKKRIPKTRNRIGLVYFRDELYRVVHPRFYQFIKIKLVHVCVKEFDGQELLGRFESICSCKYS